ncbi:MAG: aminotransferase class IV [Chlorobi bacterium]|nr:aminotransferase class IV [Chlorobiota bacterium]
MESCLLSYFIRNNDIKDCCDFSIVELPDRKSIYEVIRVIDGIPLFLDEHINRFFNSLYICNLNHNISKSRIIKNLKVLIDLNGLKNGNVKWVLTWGLDNEQDFYMWASPYLYPSEQDRENGIACDLVLGKRENPNSKNSDSVLRKRVQAQLNKLGAYEIILMDEDEKLLEGSRSNLFFIGGNTIYTSFDADVLEGVSRQKIMGICEAEGIKLIKKEIHLKEINKFDAAFLSGTSIKILPINRIGPFDFVPNNKLFLKILDKFQSIMDNDLRGFKWN